MTPLLNPFLRATLYFKTIQGLGKVWGSRKIAHVMYTNYVITILEKLGVVSFLEEPRSYDEIKTFLGPVEREDLLKNLLDVAVRSGIMAQHDNGFKVNYGEIEKLKDLKKRFTQLKDVDDVYRAAERYLSKTALEILRGKSKDRGSPEVALTYYWQENNRIFNLGREILLLLGGKRRLKGKTILDLGCRFGTEPFLILKFLDFDCSLIAADFYSTIIDECRNAEVNVDGTVKRLFDLGNISFLTLDPKVEEPFPLDDGSVDVVYAFQILQWYPSAEKIVEECARVLKDGGLLLVSTPLKKKPKVTTQDVFFSLVGGHGGFTVEEFDALLKRTGFTRVRTFSSAFIRAEKWSRT